MAIETLKKYCFIEDEARFNGLFLAVEEAIENFQRACGPVDDSETMQVLDMVGQNLFRDSWDDFKKADLIFDSQLKSAFQEGD